MKVVGVRDARASLAEYLELAQHERVLLTQHGKPVALLVGLQDYDLEDVARMQDEQFWKWLEQRRQRPTVSSAEMRKRLGLPPKKPAPR